MKQQATAAAPSDTLLVIQQFHDAFNRHDVDAIMALMTDDCVFENTFPPPDGERYAGAAAVHAFWETFFHNSPNAYFAIEESFTGGDRGVSAGVTPGKMPMAKAATSAGWTFSVYAGAKWRRSYRT